jgi:hypothetical protein
MRSCRPCRPFTSTTSRSPPCRRAVGGAFLPCSNAPRALLLQVGRDVRAGPVSGASELIAGSAAIPLATASVSHGLLVDPVFLGPAHALATGYLALWTGLVTTRAWATSSPSPPAIRPRPSAASADAKGSAVCSLSTSEAPPESPAIENWDITGTVFQAPHKRPAAISAAPNLEKRLIGRAPD